MWRFNAAIAPSLALDPDYAQRLLLHYTRQMAAGGKYALTVWPYRSMLGGIGHALVAAMEEAMRDARHAHVGRVAEYLLAMPLLGDYLADGLAEFGHRCDE